MGVLTHTWRGSLEHHPYLILFLFSNDINTTPDSLRTLVEHDQENKIKCVHVQSLQCSWGQIVMFKVEAITKK